MNARQLISGAVVAILLASTAPRQASAGPDPFIGEIMWVGFTFCPRGWVEAAGQLLAIAQNQALFSLYGTTYGGDGRTSFGLPDLRGRVAVGVGQGPGLSDRRLGHRLGTETEVLSVAQMARHNHLINASQGAIDNDPSGSIPGGPARTRIYDAPTEGSTTLAANAMAETGGGEPHNTMQPSLVLRACIALQGGFPSRN